VPAKAFLPAEPQDGHTWWWTHPPPPVPSFLLTQSISQRTLPEVKTWSWKSWSLHALCTYISTWTKCHSEKVVNIVSASLNYQLQSIALHWKSSRAD